MAAVSIALGDEIRVDAERGVVQKHAPVNLAHIDPADPAGSDEPDHAFEVERQPQIPRKVVHSAERQDAQWDIRAGEDGGGSPYAPVSATNHDSIESRRARFSRHGRNLALYSIGDPGAWHDGDRRVEIVRRAVSRDPLPRPIDP